MGLRRWNMLADVVWLLLTEPGLEPDLWTSSPCLHSVVMGCSGLTRSTSGGLWAVGVIASPGTETRAGASVLRGLL